MKTDQTRQKGDSTGRAGRVPSKANIRCETYLTPAEVQAMNATTLLAVAYEGSQVRARGRALRRSLSFYLKWLERHGGDDLALMCGGAK